MQQHHTEHKTKSTILFTHYGDDWIRGSERCLLDLLTHLDRSRYQAIVWCNSKKMAHAVRRLNIPAYRSRFPLLFGWKNPRFNVLAFVGLIYFGIRLVNKHQVKLIHANSGAPNQWLNLVARIKGIPLLSHLHSRYPMRDRLTLGLHQVSMSVGVSRPVVNQLLADGMPRQRTRVIANGIDVGRLDRQKAINLRNLLHLGKDEFIIASTGSLIHRKGMDLVIEAVSRLVKQNIPARLVIIGEGPEAFSLQQQIEKYGMQKRIKLLGERQDNVGLLRGGVDLFVSAAREEVFGLVLAEAGLACLPVVAPAVGGIPSVVIDGKTGTLFPSENIDALTQAIRQFYLCPYRRRQMGVAGRQHILDNFTIQHNVQQFEQLYGQLLNDPAMQMRWYSHWQWKGPLINGSKKLLQMRFIGS